ncbi:copper resistance system multicopper oxidase [Altererythrobacter sp.]|uniref:copper resistance system multicopper oxidase n=1 Tax=Altererythrobacter sp. TaxID=1872480 RepID=UPI003D147CF0
MTSSRSPSVDRRRFIASSAALAALLGTGRMAPAWARSGTTGLATGGALSGDEIALTIEHNSYSISGRTGHAIAVNGTLPAPLIRLREGQNVRIAVTNWLHEQSSIHWHGLLVPFQMDGVPGVSFPGIDAGQTFVYEFPVLQSGTYWYHSHSGMQEALGLYGPIVIDPAGMDTQYDREHVLVLSDWSSMHPHEQLRRLKRMGGYFNFQRQTLAGLLAGKGQSLSERIEWGAMRMDPTDISDVTGSTYSFLINGQATAENWTGLFKPGERVRLRVINASAMTNFNFRIPGLPLTVVAADGLAVQPVETDEVQIAIAETYDFIVTPGEDAAYGIIAEAIDRSGQVRATLATRHGLAAPVPPLRERPLLTMRDMGMDMSGMDMGSDGVLDLSQPASAAADGGSMEGHSMSMRDPSVAPQVKMGPGVASLSPMPVNRMGDRPTGLEEVGHRVLTYDLLRSAEPNPDTRAPSRQIELHLTANMERYMWSIDGEALADAPPPIPFRLGERVRVRLVNDTMMPHPIHLHGHFFELVTGQPGRRPRKHTVNVLPGGTAEFDLTADAEGDWAFHCHMLLHMHAGMMRVVTVRDDTEAA